MINSAQRGDVDAFNVLVLNYQDMLYRIALRIVHDECIAEDAVQEAMIHAFRHIRSFRGGNFKSWLARVTVNASYDELRRGKRHLAMPLEQFTSEGEEIESPEWMRDSGPGPEERAESSELRRALHGCIKALAPDYRLMVILVDMEGMSYDEAAQVVRVPVGTVKSRLARARMQIRKSLQAHRSLLPAIYQALMQMDLSGVDLSRLKGWACGGAALPEATIRFFADRGAPICNGFGMTETGPTGFLIDRDAAIRKIGSVGKPQMMTEARLDGVPDGQPGAGELLLRGPTVTPGYLDNPQATEAAFTTDGWLKSGDVAARDADGYYRIIDRIKDMYISGGENVYPAEVEKVLITHPAVLEAAVIGIADPRWGETGVAFLIARPGQVPDPAELNFWLRERLASYKVPKTFLTVADFPRTAAGKVRKPELRKLLP